MRGRDEEEEVKGEGRKRRVIGTKSRTDLLFI